MINIAQEKRLFLLGCLFLLSSKVSATCTDNIQNGDETDVDCGGSHCARRCSINQKCTCDSDCYHANCVMGTCLNRNATILAVCQLISRSISSASQVFYPPEVGYVQTIDHYASSSIMSSICGVQPGSVADVAIILKIIGQYRAPFAVKGGGYTYTPEFSSTPGVQISMTRFQNVIYHPDKRTVDLGSGLIWDDVYKALEPYNVTVVGSRVKDVGVAGYILGGGFSWKTSQYALSMDNVLECELVSPYGTTVYVNNHSYPDIFFGLKGGFNNFGIVTRFTMRALSQTAVYGGILIYNQSQFEPVIQGMVNFVSINKDPKAAIIGSPLNTSGTFLFYLLMFYDAPTAPNGIFDRFLAIPHISTLQTQSYRSFVELVQSSISLKYRLRSATVSITNVSTRLLNGIINQITYDNSVLGSKTGAFFLINVESYVSSYLDTSQGGVYPHPASAHPEFPIEIQYSWLSPTDDALFIDAIKSAQETILQLVLDEGQDVGGSKQILLPNYALDDTPLRHVYGDNLPRVQKIRRAWDPNNVMCLTGGFKFGPNCQE